MRNDVTSWLLVESFLSHSLSCLRSALVALDDVFTLHLPSLDYIVGGIHLLLLLIEVLIGLVLRKAKAPIIVLSLDIELAARPLDFGLLLDRGLVILASRPLLLRRDPLSHIG